MTNRLSEQTAFEKMTARSPTVRAVKTISELIKEKGLRKTESPWSPAPLPLPVTVKQQPVQTAFEKIAARSPTVRAAKTISELIKEKGWEKRELPVPVASSSTHPRAVALGPHTLYATRVMHHRLMPVVHRFVYHVFYLLIDLDRLVELKQIRLLSHNRFNLFSFNDRDHGPRTGAPLKPWIEGLLRARKIHLEGGKIRLLAMPRILGYGFNPIALWYCTHLDGSLRAVLVEVNNTFGAHHFYLVHRDGAPLDYTQTYRKTKLLHVSPLMDMHSEYRFRFSELSETLGLLIETYNPTPDRLMHVATIAGDRQKLNDAALLKQFSLLPLMTVKVVAAIHWQAVRMWMKGATYYRDPGAPKQLIS
ncbi:MAG: DUF1365 domain-containing protein [Nevskiales bacterium]